MDSWEKFLHNKLSCIKNDGLFRKHIFIDEKQGILLNINGKTIINFSSNDYLGLSQHPLLIERIQKVSRDWGIGSTASRLICGTSRLHQLLEEQLASITQSESSLVFSTGFSVACGVFSALFERGDHIILDRLSHASLIDGAYASRASIRSFLHNDLNHLETKLKLVRQKNPFGKILVVTESVFSMDGDLTPLREIVQLKNKYGAWLFLDESHAFGVLGKGMEALSGLYKLNHEVDIRMGTFGKSLGTVGGFILGKQLLIDYLINKARSYIYSTSLPMPIIAATSEAINLLLSSEGEFLQKKLAINRTEMYHRLPGAIIPYIIGDEKNTLLESKRLLDSGFFIPAIRYPSVKKSRARLRITVSALHTQDQIRDLKKALQKKSQYFSNFSKN